MKLRKIYGLSRVINCFSSKPIKPRVLFGGAEEKETKNYDESQAENDQQDQQAEPTTSDQGKVYQKARDSHYKEQKERREPRERNERKDFKEQREFRDSRKDKVQQESEDTVFGNEKRKPKEKREATGKTGEYKRTKDDQKIFLKDQETPQEHDLREPEDQRFYQKRLFKETEKDKKPYQIRFGAFLKEKEDLSQFKPDTAAAENYKQDINVILAEQKKYLTENIKSVEFRALSDYYNLIFRARMLPEDKGQELQELLFLIKRNNIKLQKLDLSQFCFIFNLETYNLYKQQFQLPVKMFAEYVEYVLRQAKNIQLVQNLDMIFSMCRDHSHKNGLLYNSDPTLLILKSFQAHNIPIDQVLPTQEIAKWMKPYFSNERGLNFIGDILKTINHQSIILEIEKVINQIQAEGSELSCLRKFPQYYQSLKMPVSVPMLEILSILAAKAQHWSIVADIFENFQQYAPLKSQKSAVFYKNAIDLVLNNSKENTVNTVIRILNEAQHQGSEVPKFSADIAHTQAMIKDGQYQAAYNYFHNNVVQKQVIEYQREKIRRFLHRYIQETNEISTIVDPNPKYEELMLRIDSFVNQLQPQYLRKCFQDEQSDQTLIEAITNTNDPILFWEEQKKVQAFQDLRNGFLGKNINIKDLIFPEDEVSKLYRHALDNYEYFLAIEKESRIQERKEQRQMQVIDSLSLPYLLEHKEDLMQILEDNVPTKMLEANIFGKIEKEFPEIEEILELRELVHLYEKDNPNKTRDFRLPSEIRKQIERDFSVDFQLLEEKIDEVLKIRQEPKKPAKNLIAETIPKVTEEDQKEGEMREEDEKSFSRNQGLQEKLPDLNSPQAIKDFIRKYYDPHADLHDFGNVQQNPDKFKDKSYGKFISIQNLEEMKWRYYNIYNALQEYVQSSRLPDFKESQIWDMMAWGIQNNEPMAIRLGEYYSELTGINVPNHISKLVGHYYKYQVKEPETEQKFTQAYQIMGSPLYHKVYDQIDSVFAKPWDRDLIKELECSFEFKGHARALLETDFSINRYKRYGVTKQDILRTLRQQQQVV